jgi:2-methylfumaryl-CoA isomerase
MTVPAQAVPAEAVVAVDRPLAGMRIVEVSTFVAAPLGGMTLAQLGAEVIRVDPLGGAADHSRWPLADSGVSLYWTGLNKAKRSFCADLRSAEGQELVIRLIAESGPEGGIVLTNSVGRSWLGYEAIARRRPDVIHLQIEGHHDGTAAVDYTVNAALGFPLLTGPQGHADPVNHVLPAWDIACGLYAAVGLLSAARRRGITGLGQALRVALYDVALATAGNLGYLAEAQAGGTRPRLGNYLYGGFGRDFTSRDGRRVMVVTLTSRHWSDLVAATGLGDAVGALEKALDVDFSIEGDRFACREVLAALLERWFAQHDLGRIRELLGGTSVLWSVYRTFPELFEGDAAADTRANPMMSAVEQPGVGEYLAPGSPVAAGGPRGAARAPLLGEHTGEVLASWLGMGAAGIRDLHDRGVVESAPREG